jgi:NADH-quinone oxidoreductase subunit H
MIGLLTIKLLLAAFVLFMVMNFAGLHTWIERKQSALIQDRIAPASSDFD